MSTATGPTTATGWKVRHQGAPQAIEGLSLEQVTEGLQEALWEPTDEVQGPGEAIWTPIESHPQLADVAAEIEPPEPAHQRDETHLDMTPLIDVCLVLLVIFILTSIYAISTRRQAMPPNPDNKQVLTKSVPRDQLKEDNIYVRITTRDGQPVYEIDGVKHDKDKMRAALTSRFDETQHTNLALEYDDTVTHGAVVQLIDQANRLGLNSIKLVVPEQKKQ